MKKIYFFVLMLFFMTAQAQITPDANNIVYVKQNGVGNGSSWANATSDFQEAINIAGVQQVWVAKGTYQPAPGEAFAMKHGVAIYGGFPDDNNSATMGDRNWTANLTTLQGNGNSVIVNNNNSLTATDILDGFIITAASYGSAGGMYNKSVSPTISHIIFLDNSGGAGGGMLNESSSPIISNVSFLNNVAYEGGAMYNYVSSPRLTNVLFAGNKIDDNAFERGGAIVNESSSPILVNTTFWGNTAPSNGGALYNKSSSSPKIYNSIFYANPGARNYDIIPYDDNGSIYNQSGSAPEFYNCSIDGSGGSDLWRSPFGTDGGGNLDTDPKFIDSANGNFRLQASSFIINKGNNTYYTDVDKGNGSLADKDLAGDDRVYHYGSGGVIDMGAYEYQGGGITPDANNIVYVKQDGNGDGSSWVNATGDFQGAINAIGAEQVWVAAGTYHPVSYFSMKHGVAIYGGFPNNNNTAAMGDRNWNANVTTLSGNNNSVIVNDNNGLTISDILDGFNITGGSQGYFYDDDNSYVGGGMFNHNSSPALINLVISANAAYSGAGLANANASPLLKNVIISNNKAAGGGGGMTNFDNSSPRLTNVAFLKNKANYGGGMYNEESNPIFTNITVADNDAQNANGGGGGMNNYNASPKIYNAIFYGNTAISNSTIGNLAGSNPAFYNSLIEGSGGSAAWSSSFGADGGKNIDTNPQFIDVASGNYGVEFTSLAVETGQNTYYTDVDKGNGNPGDIDLAGNPRIYKFATSGIIDMGAFEFQCIELLEPSVHLSSPIVSDAGITQVIFNILGTNKIQQPDGKATYQAGRAILLEPGFEVESGAAFVAKIKNGCAETD